LDAAFSKGLQFLAAKSHTIMSANREPTKAIIEKDACPFFIKIISSTMIKIVKTSRKMLPAVSLFF
jgi:hypothetical protein